MWNKSIKSTTQYFGLAFISQVILNTDISKRLKSVFFNHYVLKQAAQLLLTESAESGNGGEESSCCQVAFQFLLRLCTDFQCGICYRSRPPPEGLERWASISEIQDPNFIYRETVTFQQRCIQQARTLCLPIKTGLFENIGLYVQWVGYFIVIWKFSV